MTTTTTRTPPSPPSASELGERLLWPFVGLLLGGAGMAIAYRYGPGTSGGQTRFLALWGSYAVMLVGTLALSFRVRSSLARAATLATFGAFTFLPKFLLTRTGPRYFDEYGHWRHANDIARTGRLLVNTPYLPIQRVYPGLEVLTALLHRMTGLGTWHVGQLVILVAHAGVLVVVWWLAGQLDLSPRARLIGALVYSLNASYLYFDTMFSYESLGLPLCFLSVSLALAARRSFTSRSAWRYAAGAAASAAACVTVHHVSALVMIVLLVPVAWLVPARSTTDATKRAPWVAAGIALLIACLWLAFVAHPTYGYVWPHLRSGIDDALAFVRGHGTRVTGTDRIATTRRPFAGSGAPWWEIVCAVLAPIIAAVAVGAVTWDMWRSRTQLRQRLLLLAPFGALAALYFLSLPLALTGSGGETAHRMWAFGYLGVAIFVASGDRVWDRFEARVGLRRAVVACTAALIVVGIGNNAAGLNVLYRLPGPTAFGTETRSRTPELDELTDWLRQNVPAETKVVTDRFTGEVVTGYTQLFVPSPSESYAYRLYQQGGNPSTNLRQFLRDHGFRYFVLDRRIGHDKPVQGLFQGYTGASSVSADALASVGTTSALRVVHTTPTYVVLRIDV